MGINNLKKWDEIFEENLDVVFDDDVLDQVFPEYADPLIPLVGDYALHDLFRQIGNTAKLKLRNRRCYFDTYGQMDKALTAFTVVNKQRIKLYIEYANEGIKYYKEQNGLETVTMDPLKNKEVLAKTGSITDGKTGSNTDRTEADPTKNSEEEKKTGTIGLTTDNTLRQRFENSDSTSYISDAPKAIGNAGSTQTFNTTDTTKFQKDETVTHTFGETATRTNNTTDTKSFTKEEKTTTNMKTFDPYALIHINDFVNSLISPLLTLYMDYFFKEWTSPVVR